MLELNFESHGLEAPNQPPGGLGLVEAVEVVGAEVAVLDAVTKHVEGSGEHRGRDSENGPLGTAPGLQAQELAAKVAILLPDGGPGCGDERGLEPRTVLAYAGRTSLPGALIVPRAQAYVDKRVAPTAERGATCATGCEPRRSRPSLRRDPRMGSSEQRDPPEWGRARALVVQPRVTMIFPLCSPVPKRRKALAVSARSYSPSITGSSVPASKRVFM